MLESGLIADNGRIINISSRMAEQGVFNTESFRARTTTGYRAYLNAYSNSKLCQALYSYELQRRLRARGSKIDVFVVHPGFVRTQFGEKSTGMLAGA